MKFLKYSILFLLMLSFGLNAQESQLDTDVSAYLSSNGAMLQYDYAYDQLVQMLSKQFPKSESNGQGWQYLEKNKTKAVAEMKALLIPVYVKHFKHDDIKKMTAFYQSDTGKQLVKDRSKMTETQKEELNTFYNSEVGALIIEKQPVLTQEIGSISENWSRDLYETALSLLKQ